MELQVLVSKKGTKVVTATNLHQVLQLADHHYATNVKKWLNDVYEFHDGIRKPIAMRDFARRQLKDNHVLKDYYISVELAKLITLSSKSKVKQKYAKWLYLQEDKMEDAELMSKDQVKAVLELTKAMGLVSCQEACERQHMKTYEERNGGSPVNWWKHRASLLGYSTDRLRKKMKQLGIGASGKSQRQMLMQMDKHEMVRTGVIDLFMAIGKSEHYARSLGDLAKFFAKELNIDVQDDRSKMATALQPNTNTQVINDLKAFNKQGVLSLW